MSAEVRNSGSLKLSRNDATKQKQINEITEKIIGASFAVTNQLGCGFLEKVYENALSLELQHAGLKCCNNTQ